MSVESTDNSVVSKRFVKKQRKCWTQHGAQLLLQTRVQVLNDAKRIAPLFSSMPAPEFICIAEERPIKRSSSVARSRWTASQRSSGLLVSQPDTAPRTTDMFSKDRSSRHKTSSVGGRGMLIASRGCKGTLAVHGITEFHLAIKKKKGMKACELKWYRRSSCYESMIGHTMREHRKLT